MHVSLDYQLRTPHPVVKKAKIILCSHAFIKGVCVCSHLSPVSCWECIADSQPQVLPCWKPEEGKSRKGGGSWACCCLPWGKSFGGCMKEGQPLQPVLKCIFWWATLYHSPLGFPCASADYWVSLAGPASWVVACCGLCCPIHAIAALFAEENNLKFLSLKYHFSGSLQIEKVICAGRFLSLVLHKWIQTAFLLDHCQGFYLLVTGALASDPFRSSSGANDVCNSPSLQHRVSAACSFRVCLLVQIVTLWSWWGCRTGSLWCSTVAMSGHSVVSLRRLWHVLDCSIPPVWPWRPPGAHLTEKKMNC